MSIKGDGKESNYTRQIAVYKTDKKLFELLDRLNPAPIEHYATLHAQADNGPDGKRVYSNIGIVVMDYSQGKGDKTIRAEATVSPEEALYIYSKVFAGVEEFSFSSEKIFGQPDQQGYAIMRKLRIARASTGSDGKPRRYPWYIEAENGKGIKAVNQNGGSHCKSGSFISEKKAYVNLTDMDFFKMMCRTASFITAWEMAYGVKLIKDGRTAFEAFLAKRTSNIAA